MAVFNLHLKRKKITEYSSSSLPSILYYCLAPCVSSPTALFVGFLLRVDYHIRTKCPDQCIYLQTVGIKHMISSFLWNNLNPTWMLILLRREEIRWCMSQAKAVTTIAAPTATSTISTTSVPWSCWLMNSFWKRVEKGKWDYCGPPQVSLFDVWKWRQVQLRSEVSITQG